ncbi:hypothetical protein LSAT2_019014 [Lamellibrachia satsuma]|nr:hypothetical protein LSAT2_019014 [Lamellibrachia satsuma]
MTGCRLQFVNTSAYDKYATTERVKQHVVVLFLVLAVVLNTLSFATMQRKRLRRMTPSIYLRCLAVTDTLSVVFFACNQSTLLRNVHTDLTCGLTRSLQHAFMMMSAWVTVALTVERFICINHPLYRRKKALCSRKHAIWSTATIVLLCLAISAFFLGNTKFVQEGDISRCVNADASRSLMTIYHEVTCTGLTIVVPSTIIVVVNGLVINRMVCQRQDIMSKPKLATAAAQATSSLSRITFDRKLPTDKITVMLLVVSFYFPLCASPRIFDQLIYQHSIHMFDVLKVTSDEQAHMTADTNMRFSVLQLFMFTNYIVNFFLYILFGRTFRRAFSDMMRESLCCCCRDAAGYSGWGHRVGAATKKLYFRRLTTESDLELDDRSCLGCLVEEDDMKKKKMMMKKKKKMMMKKKKMMMKKKKMMMKKKKKMMIKEEEEDDDERRRRR